MCSLCGQRGHLPQAHLCRNVSSFHTQKVTYNSFNQFKKNKKRKNAAPLKKKKEEKKGEKLL